MRLSKPSPPLLLLAAIVATAGLAQPVSAGEEWALFAREGGCHPILSLKRRLADMPDVKDPEAFQAYLRSQGWPFTRKTHPAGSGKAVEFVVESQGLALMFVTRNLCGTPSGPGR